MPVSKDRVSARLFLPTVVYGNLLFQLCGLSEEPSGFFNQALRRSAQFFRLPTKFFGIARRLSHLLTTPSTRDALTDRGTEASARKTKRLFRTDSPE